MFTGIVQQRGRVASIRKQPSGIRLIVDPAGWSPPGIELGLGDSICISGVCLTLAHLAPGELGFDVIPETLAKTTLGQLRKGSPVNLEPSLTATSQLGGHFVQGHVEGVGRVVGVKRSRGERRLRIVPPADLVPYIIPKGSITLDGVSMTVAAVIDDAFEVALIPTTIRLTTLGLAEVGSRINIETDIISRTIVHHLQTMAEAAPPEAELSKAPKKSGTKKSARSAVTRARLRRAGFAFA